MAAFMAKYGSRMVQMTPEQWGRHFSVPIRIRPEKIRGV
jgi:hypothetical protein